MESINLSRSGQIWSPRSCCTCSPDHNHTRVVQIIIIIILIIIILLVCGRISGWMNTSGQPQLIRLDSSIKNTAKRWLQDACPKERSLLGRANDRGGRDSNPRPPDLESGALPAELHPFKKSKSCFKKILCFRRECITLFGICQARGVCRLTILGFPVISADARFLPTHPTNSSLVPRAYPGEIAFHELERKEDHVDHIPWARVEMALSQDARDAGLDKSRVRDVISRLPELVALCGSMTQTRKLAYRIGRSLLHNEPNIIVPVCPAYTHRRGKYTYQGVNGGIPLLARAHEPFLKQVLNFLPDSKVSFLIADQEANSDALCRVLGITSDEFRERVRRSSIRTRKAFEPYGWDVRFMTEAIEDWFEREESAMQWIRERPWFDRRIRADVIARTEIYKRIGYEETEYYHRSVRTAAQYIALGMYCRERFWLIANHETPSLAWYLKTHVGFLHNPIRVY